MLTLIQIKLLQWNGNYVFSFAICSCIPSYIFIVILISNFLLILCKSNNDDYLIIPIWDLVFDDDIPIIWQFDSNNVFLCGGWFWCFSTDNWNKVMWLCQWKMSAIGGGKGPLFLSFFVRLYKQKHELRKIVELTLLWIFSCNLQ